MPNYIANVLRIKGAAALPLFTEEDGKRHFDFKKIIPMPQSLDIESGSMTDWSIVYYLTERCTVPLNCLDAEKKKIIDETITNMFSKSWAQEVFNRVMEGAYKNPPCKNDAMYAKGKIYVDNFTNYGHTTWYGWCSSNWGTKWNAMMTQITGDDEIVFQTAWNMPEPVIEKVSKMYPELEIEIHWADEDKGANTGMRVYKNGTVIKDCVHENCSDEAYAEYSYCWSKTKE